jgi:predicted permease
MNWLKQLFSRNRLYGDVSNEIRAHIEERTDELIAGGMPRDEAAAAARREFGNATVIEERSREVWQWPSLESFLGDIRYAFRQLRRNPGFATVVILTLAIGIGANTTIFSWTRAVLLNPLPGAGDSDRVAALESLTPSNDWTPTSHLDFRDLRDNSKMVESMAATYPTALAVGNDNNVERIWGEIVSGNYFDVLRVQPELGRFFAGAERGDDQNSSAVVVISHSLWVSHYHSDPAALGATVRLNRYPFTIIGVAPPAFHGSMPGLDFEMWAPTTTFKLLNSSNGWMLEDRKTRMFRVMARLAPGVQLEQARAEIHSLGTRMAAANADTSEGMSATLLPMSKSHYGIQDSLRAPLGLLTGACAVLLLIVCANVANLLLGHSMSRRKEFCVRLALGAPRSRLVRQLLTETLLLAFAGSLFGLLATVWLGGSLGWLMPPSAAPWSLLRPHVDSGVLLFTAALAIGVAILAGLAPALHAGRDNVTEALKESGRTGTGTARSQRLRGLLVTSEMALAVIAVIGAGLFLKSFRLAAEIRPGFDADHVALGKFDLAAASFDASQADAFCTRLRQQLESQPGITSVSYTDWVPLSVSGGSWEDLEIEGYVPGPSENMKIYRQIVAPGYFDVVKIPVLEGRDFNLDDNREQAPAMIVNREFVRRFLRNQYAIGRKVRGWGKWFTIVGVVEDSKYYRLTESPTPWFYVPMRQIYRPEFAFAFLVRTAGSADSAISTLRAQARSVDPGVPIFATASFNEFIGASLFLQKIAASLLSVLATIAFLLAAIGLYGVMAYSVSQRTKEIGIRVTLGAQPGDVLGMIVRQALAFLLVGLVGGMLGAAILARLVSSMLFGVSPADPVVFASVAAVTLLIALAATAIPAARAMRVDPILALRHE